MTRASNPTAVVASSSRAAIAGTLGLVAAGLYSDWLFLEPFFGAGLSPARSYVSELSALTRPHHQVFNIADIVCGLCVVVLAGYVRRHMSGSSGNRCAAALAVFGLTTSAGGFFPMTCAPSAQAQCSAGGLALNSPVQDQVATIVSVVSAVAVVLSMVALGSTLPDRAARVGLARVGLWFFAVAAPLTALVGMLGLLEFYVGIPQRLLLVVDSAWVATLCLAMPWPSTTSRPQAADEGDERRADRGRARSR